MASELIGRNFQWNFLYVDEKLFLEAAKGRPKLAQNTCEEAAITKVQRVKKYYLLDAFGANG